MRMPNWCRRLAKGWFVPIYLAIVVLAAHLHVFTGRFWFGAAASFALYVIQIWWSKRRARAGAANDN